MASLILIIVITAALIVIALTTVLNVFTLLRLGQAPRAASAPTISILIPARNEADVIRQTVYKLLSQSYPVSEIIVLDDQSTDGTAAAVLQAAGDDDRVRVIYGKSLPPGWAGKNWACYQLSEAATGDWLIFTDADVQWQSGALQAVVDLTQHTQADLLTAWSTQETVTWGERLVVPLMAFAILGYLPHIAVNHVPLAAFAAANGQCMVFRRKAYRAIGGHAAVKNEIVEDIRLAQHIKRSGLKLRMADGNNLITCRMYTGWNEVRNGYAKNIIAGYGDSVIGLLVGWAFHWLVFLFPWVWLVVATIRGNWVSASWALTLIVIGLLVRALTAAATRQRLWDAALLPISVLLMSVIAGQGLWWHWRYGGPRWKDRIIVRQKSAKDPS